MYKIFTDKETKSERQVPTLQTMEEKIQRINELYHKSKKEGLNAEEQAEQKKLRQEYLENVRNNLRAQMNQIDVIEPDGTVVNLGEKHGK